MADDREDRIRARAHEIWQREGSPEGREHDHWSQAEQEVDAETTAAGAVPSDDDSAPQPRDRTGSAAAKI